jgi:DNA (cytosine-5)-methyltransferase 1
MNNKKIKVAEMFAGVGGFHLALDRADPIYNVVWANQWEPDRKAQYAYDVYAEHFGKNNNISNEDINDVKMEKVPDIDMVVGGFPCQDYSVAHSGARGIVGKKGVLWWEVLRMVQSKNPQYLLLENVDRLLTSPGVRTDNTGRDFAMMLRTLNDEGYAVQWRVINAADYGFPQRRKRVFIFAFKNTSNHFKKIVRISDKFKTLIMYNPFSINLPVNDELFDRIDMFSITSGYEDIVELSEDFNLDKGFRNTGTMIDGEVYSAKTVPKFSGYHKTLGDILCDDIDETLFLRDKKLKKIEYLKSAKSMTKTRKHPPFISYKYSEGAIAFPDYLDKPSRTMVTSEHSTSRMTHVIMDPKYKRYRLLSPEETEKLNTFPAGWTKSIPDSARYFTMGNALVVDLVKEIAKGIVSVSNNNF